MNAWHILKRGTVQDILWGEVPEAVLKGTKVLVLGAALNPADLKVLSGKNSGKFLHANRFPIRLGYDFCGKTENGEEVFGFLPYAFSNSQGAFSVSLRAAEDSIAKKPSNLSHPEAASLATAALTALQGLRDQGRVTSGMRVLVNGASGGVGSFAVQIAKLLGARVTGMASAKNLDFVRSLGADETVDYRVTPLSSFTEKFDVCFDVASNSSFAACNHLLNRGGTYITLLPSAALPLGMLHALIAGKNAKTVMVKSRKNDLEQVAKWVEAGVLRHTVSRVFSKTELPQALELLRSGQCNGKIAISMVS